jgi:hypothetical protein
MNLNWSEGYQQVGIIFPFAKRDDLFRCGLKFKTSLGGTRAEQGNVPTNECSFALGNYKYLELSSPQSSPRANAVIREHATSRVVAFLPYLYYISNPSHSDYKRFGRRHQYMKR